MLPSGLLEEKCFHPQGTTEPGHAFPSGVEEASSKAVLPPTPHCATPHLFQLTQHPFNLLRQSFSRHTDAFGAGVDKEGQALGTAPFAAHHLSTGTGHYQHSGSQIQKLVLHWANSTAPTHTSQYYPCTTLQPMSQPKITRSEQEKALTSVQNTAGKAPEIRLGLKPFP